VNTSLCACAVACQHCIVPMQPKYSWLVFGASVVLDELISGEHRVRYLLAALQFHDLVFLFTLQGAAVIAARISV
jgi:hypothetical protein